MDALFQLATVLSVIGTLWMGWPVSRTKRQRYLLAAATLTFPWLAWLPYLVIRRYEESRVLADRDAHNQRVAKSGDIEWWRWAAEKSDIVEERIAAIDMLAYLGAPLQNPGAVLAPEFSGGRDMDGRRAGDLEQLTAAERAQQLRDSGITLDQAVTAERRIRHMIQARTPDTLAAADGWRREHEALFVLLDAWKEPQRVRDARQADAARSALLQTDYWQAPGVVGIELNRRARKVRDAAFTQTSTGRRAFWGD